MGSVEKSSQGYSLYIGNERVTSLQVQQFPTAECHSSVEMLIDEKSRSLPFGSVVNVTDSFLVLPSDDERRVNIIGFSRRGIKDESGTKVALSDLVPRYSIDESNSIFRVELYKKDGFCGMILVQFNKE